MVLGRAALKESHSQRNGKGHLLREDLSPSGEDGASRRVCAKSWPERAIGVHEASKGSLVRHELVRGAILGP